MRITANYIRQLLRNHDPNALGWLERFLQQCERDPERSRHPRGATVITYDHYKDTSREVMARCGLKLVPENSPGKSNVVRVDTGEVVDTVWNTRTFEWLRANGYARPFNDPEDASCSPNQPTASSP